jgi:hypothetical protein
VKNIRRVWTALAAFLLLVSAAQAQVTGACPSNQFVNVVGNNIPSTACAAVPAVFTAPVTVPQGGTGVATLTAHGVLLGEGTGNIVPTSVGATGTLLQGATGADPAFSLTLSGAYIFTNPLITAGAAAGTPTHVATAQTTAPALTSCGTGSPTITGTDTAGIVTMGTSATGCIITFNVAYTAAPYCVVSWIATPLASQSYATSNTAITLTQTSASGDKIQYVCLAQAGG